MRRKKLKILTYILVMLIILVAVAAGILAKLYEKIPAQTEIFVSVPSNTSVTGIIDIYNNNGMLEPGWLFKPLVKAYTVFFDGKFYAGTYRFAPGNTNLHVLKSIFTGSQMSIVKVTIPEGLTLREIASLLARRLDIDSGRFMRAANSELNKKRFGVKGETAEGYLMPNTYDFYWEQKESQIVREMFLEQEKLWNREFEKEAIRQGRTKHEILTLASIIESETPVAEERKRVSGLYMNRLKRGMRLEADPTVQYAVGQRKRLLYKDLEFDSPYNTYKYAGLPPGPINSPGRSAIEAALYPEKNNFLYFVAVGDGSGRHNFATNYSQHLRNVASFRKNAR